MKMKQNEYEQLIKIADRCMEMRQKRPELIWIQEKCERLMEENDLTRKAELDNMIFF